MTKTKILRPSKELKDKWEKKLQDEGLGMDRAAGRPWLSYGHDYTVLPDGGNKSSGGYRTPKLPSLGEIEQDVIDS